MNRIVSFALVGAALSLSLACGGGAAPAAPTAAPAAGAPTAAPAPTTPPAIPTAAGPNLAALLGSVKTASYKVTYKLSGSSRGTPMTGEQTLYVKPPNVRMDLSGDMGGGQRGQMSMYMLSNGVFMCTREGQTMCIGFPGAQEQPSTARIINQFREADAGALEPRGTRQVAGQTATCVGRRGGQQDIMCLSNTGIPLYSETDGVVIEATQISTTVSDADFSLPAQPVTLPGAGGVPGAPNIPGIPGAPRP